MTNLTRILSSTLVIVLLAFSACSDDETAPPKQFSFDGETVSLKNGNLYLTSEGIYDTYVTREYVITDGTYDDGDYVGDTYYFEIMLGVPTGREFESGEFPLFDNFNAAATAGAAMSYVYIESAEHEFYNPNNVNGGDPVVVSGGFEDGESMTLKFNGTLTHEYDNGVDDIQEDLSGKLYFKGKVEDVRPTGTPAKVN